MKVSSYHKLVRISETVIPYLGPGASVSEAAQPHRFYLAWGGFVQQEG